MCQLDITDIADYLLEAEASLTRRISRRRRKEQLQDLRKVLNSLRKACGHTTSPSLHRTLSRLRDKAQKCCVAVENLVFRCMPRLRMGEAA